MSLEKRKPTEPAIVLIVATIAFVLGLYLPVISVNYKQFSLINFTGLEIIEALVLFGLSAFLSAVSSLLYYIGDTRKMVLITRNIAIISIIPGFIGLITLIFGQHQGYKLFKDALLNEDPTLTQAQLDLAVSQVNFSPDFGLALAFAGIIIIGLGIYMISNYLKLDSSKDKELIRFPDLPPLNSSDAEFIESLKAMWYCPNDNNKLTNNVSRTVQNAEFRVSFDRIDDNISNAVATRKIKSDMVPYVTSLAKQLLKQGQRTDIELVSTMCTICKNRYVSPKLSDWYNRSID